MGVPSFYRWLVNKYPKTVSEAVEERGAQVDCTLPNPTGLEFDNFYLDMNGIIHPCFHPDDDVSFPFLLVLKFLGLTFSSFLRQLMTRYSGEEMEEKLRQEFEKNGKPVLPKQESQVADSNVITPGTEFMYILSGKLQSYIRLRRSENPAWGDIKVILSDGNVPGEGNTRLWPSFGLSARHPDTIQIPGTAFMACSSLKLILMQDADLIMLALTTHEIHFSILREEVISVESRFSPESTLEQSLRKAESEKLASRMEAVFVTNKKQHYQFLNVWVLREYLAFDLAVSGPEKLGCDLERIIDDFIFMCFLAGNDFLPHMPSLEIHEGCIDLLMHVYKKEFQNLGGYLVDMQRAGDKKGAYIKLKRVERYILLVGAYEEKIFSKRAELRERKLRRILAEDKDAVAKYCEGLCWVLLYYFSGVPSWTWFYPYHYGPLASDVKGLSQTKLRFQKGSPFKPLDQLMGVLPPGSAHALPSAYKGLVVDENSNIIDFYPTEFETDIEGKRFTWQGICKLPFIDEERLLTETRKLENELKEIEKIRNLQNLDMLFVRWSSKTNQQDAKCSGTRKASEKIKGAIMMDSTIDGMKGTIHLRAEELSQADDYDLCLWYEIDQGCQYVPRLIEGVTIPEKTIKEVDIPETILWHERRGSYPIHPHRVQRRPMGADHNFESVARSPAPAVIHKGGGRGKVMAVSRLAHPEYLPKYAVRENCGEFRARVPAMDGDQVNTTSYWNHGARCHPMSNSKPWRGGCNFLPSGGGFNCSSREDRRLNNT
ncbi:UNVERIFIED_CONTAM: 5'-3' exoribonuclease 4 [Sesamum angustifolium]|uniref:5'-3' exoribonuclease n=1 Tax=Sesamum angustifolium TaxID=2727405 RepID=A0AAW2QNH4_9LAMI